MAQKQTEKHSHEDSEDTELPARKAEPEAVDSDFDVDGILDDIDAVLEENAEKFVREYVQKGGQ